MALVEFTHRFKTLGGQGRVRLVLPEQGAPGEAPVVLLLHGASDDGSGWLRFTAAERYAAEKNVVLVAPDARNSYYADMACGPQFFRFVTGELPAECARLFGLSRKREQNYVFGLSMGGYGALKCALTFPGQYAGCAAFSAAVRPETLVGSADWPLDAAAGQAIFGPGLARGRIPPESDLFALAEAAAAPLPRLYLACGEQDPLYPVNRELTGFLTQKNIPHTFCAGPGAHEWAYWDGQLKHAMDVFFG